MDDTPTPKNNIISLILVAILFSALGGLGGFYLKKNYSGVVEVKQISSVSPVEKNVTLVQNIPSEVMGAACKEMSTADQDKSFKASDLLNGRYYFPYANNQVGKTDTATLPEYAVFIDCFSSNKDYNYGVLDKKKDAHYYLGNVKGGLSDGTYSDQEDIALAFGTLFLATIEKEKTADKRLAFIISGGDLQDHYMAEVDFSNPVQKDGILIAKKNKFLGSISSQGKAKVGDIVNFISLYRGDYPNSF